jgi:hypothetical protein
MGHFANTFAAFGKGIGSCAILFEMGATAVVRCRCFLYSISILTQ